MGEKIKAVTESERKEIQTLCSREAEGTTAMLPSSEDGDVKSSFTRRRTQRPRRNIDLDKFSQVLRGSANDNLTAETSYCVLNPFQSEVRFYIILTDMYIWRERELELENFILQGL